MKNKLINKEPCKSNKVRTMNQILKVKQIRYAKQRQIIQAKKNNLINNELMNTMHNNADIQTKNINLLQLQHKVRREKYEKLKQFQLLQTLHKEQVNNIEQQKTKIVKSQ